MNITSKLKKHVGEEPRPLDICAVNKCKQPTEVIFLDTPLCDTHWLKHCKETENGDRSKPTATLEELYPRCIPYSPSNPILQVDASSLPTPDLPINHSVSNGSPAAPPECVQLQSEDNNKPPSSSSNGESL